MDCRRLRDLRDRLLLLALVAHIAVVPARARAGHPFDTDDTGTQGASAASVETSSEITTGAQGLVTPTAALGVQLGIEDSVDLGATMGIDFAGESDHVGGPALSLKWRALGGASGPSVGARIDYAPGEVAPVLGGVLLWSVVEASWALHLDAGAHGEAAAEGPWELSGSLAVYAFIGPLTVGADVCVAAASDGSRQRYGWTVGAAWNATAWMTWSAGISVVAESGAAELGLGVRLGVTFSLGG